MDEKPPSRGEKVFYSLAALFIVAMVLLLAFYLVVDNGG
jgi:hypothetical protein